MPTIVEAASFLNSVLKKSRLANRTIGTGVTLSFDWNRADSGAVLGRSSHPKRRKENRKHQANLYWS